MAAKRRKHVGDTLKVGDQVKVAFGRDELIGTIVEDRGNIGVRGRRILRVRVNLEHDNDFTFESPAEELTPAA